MFSKVVTFFLLPMLILSLILSFAGVQQISFDETYMNFMRTLSNNLNGWKVSIPSIPTINYGEVSGFDLISYFVSFFNFFINIFNVLIAVLNVLIELIQLICTFVYTIITFRDSFITNVVNIIGI